MALSFVKENEAIEQSISPLFSIPIMPLKLPFSSFEPQPPSILLTNFVELKKDLEMSLELQKPELVT